MLPICIIAQTTIFLKKQFEHRRDHVAVGNIKDKEEKDNTNCMNTQRWNPYMRTTWSTVFIMLLVFIFHIFGNVLLEWSNLNSHEKSLLGTNVFQTILCLGVPLHMYGKNMTIFQHLIHEILGEFIVIENMPTYLPNLTSMIYPSMQRMKMTLSQKLQSKSEPTILSPSSAIKMTNDIIPNQVQEVTFDKVNEESNHDYPKHLPYQDQKALLSAARLKEAGFQLSNKTPEDGNCLIHALKDQMR